MFDAVPLRELPVLAVDCQSTGATPAHGDLLEVGWARRGEGPTSMLVSLPEGRSVPRVVTRVTGITDADLDGAVPPAEAWRRLSDAASRGVPAVVHYARFEDRFLRHLHATHGEGAFPFEFVCTHAIARRLLPDLPRRGLRALSGCCGGAPSTDDICGSGPVDRAQVDENAVRRLEKPCDSVTGGRRRIGGRSADSPA